ncbi:MULTISPECIES: hypothetical protein [unclassified Meiothermus]|uniref:hypothetical protein n=1 Tax=unclassified Meiothermus TaxID=370471 RepID=UPI000D7BB541|nr:MULTISPECIES: hypothetical protein [unclassified Meiothermus]PZA06494.1 hypothetical protein DNA98_12980 [Meiothermus sp. Pnk-1]RYM36239.1 hypothetical protein EWH23_10555 [Meiothermus sp. PNK-Is4]
MATNDFDGEPLRLIRYGGDNSVLAEIEWRGPGDYRVLSGQLDDDAKDVLEAVGDMPYYIDGYANVSDAYEGRPYFGWPEEDEG